MSYNQSNSKRVRASSAKVSSQKRPSSGNSHKNHPKLDFIENMYGPLAMKRNSLRNGAGKVQTDHLPQQFEVNKTFHLNIYKQKEQFLEQNIRLKKEINYLKDQLNIQKSRNEQIRKKNSEYTNKLGLQFEKESYWTGNHKNMIRGIKNQYEQMKLKYQQKCQEYDEVTKQFIYLQAKQERAYIEVLIEENTKLVRRIRQIEIDLKHKNHGTLTSAVEQSIDINKNYKYQLHQDNENLIEQLNNAHNKNKILARRIEQNDKKFAYLDRLLIERDNSQHASWKKYKKIEKEKFDLVAEYSEFKKVKEEELSFYENKVKRVKQTLEKQSETERIIFKQQLSEKTGRIANLEKEVAYLATLLSYWKPLDQINKLVANKMTNNQSNISYQDDEKQVLLEYSMGSTMIKNNLSQKRQMIVDEESETKSIAVKSRKESVDNNRNISDLMTKSIDLSKKQPQRKRVQITADKRSSEESVKTRKVGILEVEDICETIKYRFIGFGISMQQVRKFFDYNPEVQIVDSQEEQSWKKLYISMKEVKQILANKIFGLNEEDAHIFSRYLIEDSQNDYVYCDPNNEHLRSVVKSIIKTAVGQFELPPNKNAVIEKAKDIMSKYDTNLQSALHVTAPKGLISKKKLLQLFKGLGIQLSSDIQDFFIGKLVIESQNLNNLKYQILFKR